MLTPAKAIAAVLARLRRQGQGTPPVAQRTPPAARRAWHVRLDKSRAAKRDYEIKGTHPHG